jgi:hypothetical protein
MLFFSSTRILVLFFVIIIMGIGCTGCGSDTPPIQPPTKKEVKTPTFDRQKAYDYVAKQVSFGPRVPETAAHDSCATWIKSTFEAAGWTTQYQIATVPGFDDQPMQIKNIIASIHPERKNRVLLCAHWDTRRVADQDTVRKQEPIVGADDGGSGVGVLLALAEAIQQQPIDLGIDIVLFDAEDQGESSTPNKPFRRETWCIGSQYWSKNMHPMAQKPYMGILLDMVGSRGARFPKEGVSMRHAAGVVNQVWGEALQLGYSDLFVNKLFGELVDDHVFVNDIAKIPTIDIINLPTNPALNSTFGHYWHTHNDNMSIIDKHTLGAVGDVLIQVLYKNAAGVL